jgi:hypothetical protein
MIDDENHEYFIDEFKKFLAALGARLLRQIEEAGDTLGIGINEGGLRIIAADVHEHGGKWNADIRYYKKALLPIVAPKLLDSFNIGLNDVLQDTATKTDVRHIVENALRCFSDSTLHKMATAREPIAFSYLDSTYRQAEVRVLQSGTKFTFDVQLD